MARLDKTLQNYQEQLKNKGIKNIPEFVQSILDADITKGKYSRFLLDCYIQNKFRQEDLKGGLESTIGQAITLFHKHKGKLPEQRRSIYRYDSPGSLWSAVKQFDGELSGKEIKREEQDRIYTETEFLYENVEIGLKIVSPLTEESAKWWGKGTRWCTSAKNNNMFLTYAKDAPLLILLMPGGEKLQLWKGKYIQFMDEADNQVTLDYIEKKWNVLEPIITWMADLNYVPKELITEEIFRLTVKKNEMALYHIPEHLRTKEICRLAVEQNGNALQYVPFDLRTEELCELAVQNDGWALEYVPEEMRTEEIYKLTIKNNGRLLFMLPKKYKTEEFYKIAVQSSGYSLQYVPEEMRTEELYQIAIKNDGEALQYIPYEMRTEELCKLAVKQNGNALQYVPQNIKKYEIYKLAVHNNWKALKFVPKNMQTEDICKLAVQQNGIALYHIPEHLRTEEICKLTIQQYGYALEYVPEYLKTKELCELAVQNDGYAIEVVPENMITEELCKIAVQQNRDAIDWVPDELQEQMKQYIQPEKNIIPKDVYQNIFNDLKSKLENMVLLNNVLCYL